MFIHVSAMTVKCICIYCEGDSRKTKVQPEHDKHDMTKTRFSASMKEKRRANPWTMFMWKVLALLPEMIRVVRQFHDWTRACVQVCDIGCL